MKRFLILFMVLVILMVQFPVSAGTLPSSSEIFFPSLTDVTGKQPEESIAMPDGLRQDTYMGITLAEYEAFSAYLETMGFSLVSYDVSNNVLSAILQRGENAMTFTYHYANGTAILTYPAFSSKILSQDTGVHTDSDAVSSQVVNYITFGTYPQGENGALLPIEWIEIGEIDDCTLLLSRYGLEAKTFTEDTAGFEWDECALRNWLNEDFYEVAFSSVEQAKICAFTADNDSNPYYSGKNTVNRVYLLSGSELTELNLPGDILKAIPTPYAISQGAVADADTGYCFWWLRSPENDSPYPTVVTPDGTVSGTDHFDGTVTVRPVIICDPSVSDNPSVPEELSIESRTEGPANAGEIVYTSRITGQQFTAEPGITKGFFSSQRYNSTSNGLLLPYPGDWSQGKLTQIGTETAPDGTYYQFQAVNKGDTEKLMMEYIGALEQLGFTCEREKLMTLVLYHLKTEKQEVATISLRSRVGKGSYMTCLLPPESGFEIKKDDTAKEYRLASVYNEKETKEAYSLTGFDNVSESSFALYFSPIAYQEGDHFSLQDFLAQTHAGYGSSLYYCTFRTDADSDRPFSTLDYVLYQEGSSAYFKELTVEVLRKNDSETILYFYMEADAGTGMHHKLEGLIDVVHEEKTQIYTAFPENSDNSGTELKNCTFCGGKGFDRCPKCSGSGKVRCTKCGGDGKSYNTVSKKEKKCTRCLGTGKQDCSSCTSGKRRCSICGGTGHVKK